MRSQEPFLDHESPFSDNITFFQSFLQFLHSESNLFAGRMMMMTIGFHWTYLRHLRK